MCYIFEIYRQIVPYAIEIDENTLFSLSVMCVCRFIDMLPNELYQQQQQQKKKRSSKKSEEVIIDFQMAEKTTTLDLRFVCEQNKPK